jgi:pimeloyl-ACP methyl ester carboxylesterase
VRALCAVAIPHPRLLARTPALLWRARHFITLSLPSGPWLARRRDFAYIDALMRRWAPGWSGLERERTLEEVKLAFADPRVLDAALSYYRDASPGSEPPVLTQPALIVGGTRDLIPAEAFRRTAEAFEGPCEVVIAEGAAHWPHRESSALFEQRLLAFLDGLPASSASA